SRATLFPYTTLFRSHNDQIITCVCTSAVDTIQHAGNKTVVNGAHHYPDRTAFAFLEAFCHPVRQVLVCTRVFHYPSLCLWTDFVTITQCFGNGRNGQAQRFGNIP